MLGVYCDGSSALLRRDLPDPIVRPDEVVLRVRLAGICDTDIQLARGYMNYRGILGHEFVGQLPDGRLATAEINAACHACPTCHAGRPGHCPNRTVLGILGRDGAMAELVSVPERNLHFIPDGLPDRAAVFIEPLAAAFRVAEQVPLAGARVAVVGDGKLGLLCAWVARRERAVTTLVGKHPAKLAMAGPGIATAPLVAIDPHRATFDVVIEATGSPAGLPTALKLVRPCGTVVLKTTVAGEHTMSLAPVVIDEIHLIGSRCGPFPRAIAALADGSIDVAPLIEAEFPLAEADAAFEAAGRRGVRKVLLRVHD